MLVTALCVAVSDGCHAGSDVASTEGLATALVAVVAPPTTVTAPADFGASDNWNTPMMPVSTNIVMTHSCRRFTRAPQSNSECPPRQRPA